MEYEINRNISQQQRQQSAVKQGSIRTLDRKLLNHKQENSIRSKIEQEHVKADRKVTAVFVGMITIALVAIIYLGSKTAAFNSITRHDHGQTHSQSDDSEQPVFYRSLQNFFLAVIIVTLVVAVQRVLNKRSRDFRPNNTIEQISEEEFKRQAKQWTRQEVLKLQNSQQYKQLEAVKGKALGDWNWQVKENGSPRRSGSQSPNRRNQPTFAALSDNDDTLEAELLRIDQEIQQEGGSFFKNQQQSKSSGKSVKRNLKTPNTQATSNGEEDFY